MTVILMLITFSRQNTQDLQIIIELHHHKTNKMACVPSKDSDQPAHLIRVFTVCMKKAWVLSYPLSI